MHVLAAVMLGTSVACAALPVKNVVVIHVDDLGWRFQPSHGFATGTLGGYLGLREKMLVLFIPDNGYELYNLKEDIAEFHDLSASQPEMLAMMRAQLDATYQRSDAVKILPPNPDFDPDSR